MIIDISHKTKTAVVDEPDSGKPEIDICKSLALKDGSTGYYSVATLRFESLQELERFSDEIALHVNSYSSRHKHSL